jgi:V/A-type H+-transporting ATPase subunit K
MKPPLLPLVAATLGAAAAAGTLLAWSVAQAASPTPAGAAMEASIWSWGLVAAALATGFSSLGAGYAVARLGAAAVGALAEKPELFARLLILVGLAEGIAIYGVIVSILILNRLL